MVGTMIWFAFHSIIVALLSLTICASNSLDLATTRIPLPVWKAPWETPKLGSRRELIQQENSTNIIITDFPSDLQIRLPAEYEPVASVLFSYQYFRRETYAIARQLLNYTTVDVFMVGGPDDLFGDEEEEESYYSLPFPSDSIWTRDYGPVGILVTNNTNDDDASDGAESLALINMRYRRYLERPDDNAMPCTVASLFEDWPCYEVDLIVDGGNIMTDGAGNLFTTTRTYDWNPDLSPDQVDAFLKKYFGAKTIHALDYAKGPEGQPLDGTGHIDMFAKIIDPCKVIVSETDSEVFDEITKSAADYFANLECAPNTTYEVFATKGWAIDTFHPYWGNYTVWYTYTNALIVNDVIIIPGYYDDSYSAEAMSVYQAASPNRTILQVNTDGPILLGGSIHCMTRQLPVAINSPSNFEFLI